MRIKKIGPAVLVILLALLVGAFVYFSRNTIRNNVSQSSDGQKSENTATKDIPTETLKIGFITDVHCYANYDKDANEWILNWRCTQPMNEFVRKMNEEYHPDFVIEGGDFVDGRDERSFEDFVEAKELFNQIGTPNYHVLGNHEVRSFEKPVWLGLVGYDNPYYYFDVKGYRIIVLDGNNKLTASGIIDSDPEHESYPGLIDPAQMEWLKKLMDESKGYQKIVFVHQPPFATDAKTQEELFIGGKELRQLFADNNVRAVFSGHIERMCHLDEDGVKYYVLQGFWKANSGLKKEYRFKDGGVFSEIQIDQNDVKVVANYGVRLDNDSDDQWEQRTVELIPENADCFSGETLSPKDN